MQTKDDQIEDVVADPVSAGGVVKTANRAVRDTAQRYLDAAGVKLDLADVEAGVRDRALFSVGTAAGVGFLLGGGLATWPGVILLGLFGRAAGRQMLTNIGRQVVEKTFSTSEE